MRKQLRDSAEIVRARKVRLRGKRVQLEGKFLFSTEEILKVAEDAREKQAAKRPRGRPRKGNFKESEEQIERDDTE
ncbi:uncharacterized protein V1513DRAFT_225270 [Lipomyces chichibuensis]|uniref:uncharacterized protein n=1 Tax=Lipomyces chichibuensis TaxID=1546026 RepID=UPI003343ABB3